MYKAERDSYFNAVFPTVGVTAPPQGWCIDIMGQLRRNGQWGRYRNNWRFGDDWKCPWSEYCRAETISSCDYYVNIE